MNSVISKENERLLKDCELNMLKALSEVCSKLNIQFFLVGGTLLGAVRHKGFIPWDDDIDVGMLRKDYDRFVNEGQALLPEYYFLQTNKSDPQYPYNFAKLRDSRTAFVETVLKNRDINHGVFLDIFPFDYYPEKKNDAIILELKKKFLTNRIQNDLYFEVPEKHSFVGTVMLILGRVFYPKAQKAIDAKEVLISDNAASSLVTNYCGAWGKKEIVPLAWLSEVCYLQFEDIMAPCPKYYKEYLKNVYGDYMKLPPEEKRVGHHFNEVIDLYHSYSEYLKKRG